MPYFRHLYYGAITYFLQIKTDIMSMHGEIVGLRDKTNGRQCKSHACCGDNIRPGSIVTFKLAVVLIHGKKKRQLKLYMLSMGRRLAPLGFFRNLF